MVDSLIFTPCQKLLPQIGGAKFHEYLVKCDHNGESVGNVSQQCKRKNVFSIIEHLLRKCLK